MPTYGGTLNEAITGLIENECRQIELAEDIRALRLGLNQY